MNKKLGFGLMRLPLKSDDQRDIDIEAVKKMCDYYLENGFTYFDTSYVYHGGLSENAFKQAVVERYPRDAYTVTDKIPTWMLKSEADLQKYFDEILTNLGVDYLDYLWLHTLGEANYEIAQKYHGFEFLQKMKSEGKVRHIGFSYHDKSGLLDKILTEHPEVEYVQLQINYIDWESESIESRKCYEVATKHNKPVIVMEPIKGGVLSKVSPDIEKMYKDKNPDLSVSSWAIRYAASLPNVVMVLSGMSNMEQLCDNVSYMKDFKPLDDDEHKIIDKATKILIHGSEIPCTACRYCTDGCPMKIKIPDLFSLYNDIKKFKNEISAGDYYTNMTENGGKASSCIECKQCERHCPQHIKITKWLKAVADKFEK